MRTLLWLKSDRFDNAVTWLCVGGGYFPVYKFKTVCPTKHDRLQEELNVDFEVKFKVQNHQNTPFLGISIMWSSFLVLLVIPV